jgi:hypothetical protein
MRTMEWHTWLCIALGLLYVTVLVLAWLSRPWDGTFG